MVAVVISQPMFLPWYGLFNQIALADHFVHYDDVQYPLGTSLFNRIQINTPSGIQWLTAPVAHEGVQLIKDVKFSQNGNWRAKHQKMIERNYARASFADDLMNLVESIYTFDTPYLSEFTIHAIHVILSYLEICTPCYISSELRPESTATSTEHLLELIRILGGDHYITGHGARNYLNHEKLEEHGIATSYVSYCCRPYQQLWRDDFTPYVSILDMIASVGKASKLHFCSTLTPWRDFIEMR